jgi:peptidoglycan/LPS O-acetylase OafA/YrhL
MVTNRIVSLDGLRGVAILLVMIYHYVYGFAYTVPIPDRLITVVEGLQIGVDLFFVISGYLITSRLFATRGDSRYYPKFYWRRFLRIVPVYMLFLGVVFLLQPIEIVPSDVPWYLLFGTNILMAINGLQPPLLAHLWSVALEEQFYMLWPAVIARFARRSVGVILISCYLLQPLCRFLMPQEYYMNPLTHLDGILVGAILFVFAKPISDFIRSYRYLFAMIVVIPALWVIARVMFLDLRIEWVHDFSRLFHFSLIAILFGSILASVLTGEKLILSRLLQSRVLQSLGKYSYALYLFHMLVLQYMISFLVPGFGNQALNVLYILAMTSFGILTTWVIAQTSWRYLEEPLLKFKSKLDQPGSITAEIA